MEVRKMEYVVLYQVKSGFANVCDEITLTKPASDNYDILHVSLPDGYEFDYNQFGVPRIYAPSGKACSICRTGKYGKDGPVIAFVPGFVEGECEDVILPFA